MNLLKEILTHEVYPALGCTEPVSCAYAAALAAAELDVPVERLTLRVDPSTYKNGACVSVPHSGGAKGNLVAAALGAVLARPQAQLQLLQDVTAAVLDRSRTLWQGDKCTLECAADREEFYVEVAVSGGEHTARCILRGGHTHVERIEKDGRVVRQAAGEGHGGRLLLDAPRPTPFQLAGGQLPQQRRHLARRVDSQRQRPLRTPCPMPREWASDARSGDVGANRMKATVMEQWSDCIRFVHS